jgi:hypothetical protein
VFRVVRFNWHLYGIALAAAAVCVLLGWSLAAAVLLWFVIASLCAAHWTYDRAGLHRMRWLTESLPNASKIVVVHAGYDELDGAVAEAYPSATLSFVDIYGSLERKEVSIQRAHSIYNSATEPISGELAGWPIADADLVLFAFAAHELRNVHKRIEVLKEARRVSAPNGRVVIVEHLRDLSNAVVYGPGVFHFFPSSDWLHCFAQAELKVVQRNNISPFATVFWLCK